MSELLKERLRSEAQHTGNRVVGSRMSRLCREALEEIERQESIIQRCYVGVSDALNAVSAAQAALLAHEQLSDLITQLHETGMSDSPWPTQSDQDEG